MSHSIQVAKPVFLILFLSLFLSRDIFAEDLKSDTTKTIYHLSGNFSATNNGMSLLPSFSLGQPAAIFDFSVGNDRLAFEPQFRFSLEGKPWSFIFWLRYKAINQGKLRLQVGAHPSVAFRSSNLYDANGQAKTLLESQQYVATEVVPTYVVSKNFSLGMYYLYSHGLYFATTNNTHFLSFNASISNIKLTKNITLRFNPQSYYLRMDQTDGFFVAETITINHKKLPFAISSVMNKRLVADLPGSKDFIWNISLHYLFNHRVKKVNE